MSALLDSRDNVSISISLYLYIFNSIINQFFMMSFDKCIDFLISFLIGIEGQLAGLHKRNEGTVLHLFAS